MLQRVVVGILAALFALYVIFFAPQFLIPPIMSVLCAVCVYEIIKAMTDKKNVRITIVSMIFAALFPFLIYFDKFDAGLVGITISYTMYLFVEIIINPSKFKFSQLSNYFFAVIFIPVAFTALLRIYYFEYGELLVLIPLICAYISDTFALFAGLLFGKNKLAPEISPKKTIEGSIGGILGTIFIMVLYTLILREYTGYNMPIFMSIIIAIIGSVAGQIGDLSFSAIKRQHNIKDYGTLLPGHGGVLDRLDSLIFTAPIAEVLIIFFSR